MHHNTQRLSFAPEMALTALHVGHLSVQDVCCNIRIQCHVYSSYFRKDSVRMLILFLDVIRRPVRI